MSTWHDDNGNITIDTLPELLAVANTAQFGESGQESLVAWLMCEAFKHRMDPATARAFHLAAMIISRTKAPSAIASDRCQLYGHLYRCEECGEPKPPGA